MDEKERDLPPPNLLVLYVQFCAKDEVKCSEIKNMFCTIFLLVLLLPLHLTYLIFSERKGLREIKTIIGGLPMHHCFWGYFVHDFCSFAF